MFVYIKYTYLHIHLPHKTFKRENKNQINEKFNQDFDGSVVFYVYIFAIPKHAESGMMVGVTNTMCFLEHK